MNNADNVRGALIGLATGDAVGTTLEFLPPGSFTPISDMVGGVPAGLRRGSGRTTPRWHCALPRA